jgi:hypothetical protein
MCLPTLPIAAGGCACSLWPLYGSFVTFQEVLWTLVGLVDAAVAACGQLDAPEQLLGTLVPLLLVRTRLAQAARAEALGGRLRGWLLAAQAAGASRVSRGGPCNSPPGGTPAP